MEGLVSCFDSVCYNKFDIVKKYNMLLAPYRVEIRVRGTDHEYDSWRWSICEKYDNNKRITDNVPNEVKKIACEFYEEINCRCVRCGKYVNNQNNHFFVGQTFPTNGCFMDDDVMCEECKARNEILQRYCGDGVYYFLMYNDQILREPDNDARKKILSEWDIMYDDLNGKIGYCKVKDLIRDNHCCYIATGDERQKIEVRPVAYDIGLKDIHGKKIYNTMNGFVLWRDRIISVRIDHFWTEIYRFGFNRSNVPQDIYIIIPEYDTKYYSSERKITYAELIESIGKVEAEKIIANPENKECLSQFISGFSK